MKVYNLYYSPTGGTFKVSAAVAKGICGEYENTDLLDKAVSGRSFCEGDVCVISAPAFGGRVPKNAVERLKIFSGNGAVAVLVAVFGNRATDDTLAELYDLAVSQGFEVAACIEAVAEHSLVREFGAGRPDAGDIAELGEFALRIRGRISAGERLADTVPGNRPYKTFNASAMTPVVDDACVDCKTCVRQCPVGAISEADVGVIDEKKCFSCMRCVAVCPMSARHNSPAVVSALEERLRERCAGRKANKLYL